MTVRDLMRLLSTMPQGLPVEIHDPYGEADDEWLPDDQEPVRHIPGKCVAIHLGTRIGVSEDE
jgi:hypothetical protein